MLEGQKISLRCLEAEDLPLIAAWRNQSEIRRSFFNKLCSLHLARRSGLSE
ncbi:hypothetical protein [Paenibacillus germinis]|uniref:hypothetical protein n=1 Tax=Paenibacillus germinis TaxID=2654979 RepID=UPI001490B038|nr:hypothetical protein [Paenibacillus germinis]